MISALNGGNTARPPTDFPELDWIGLGWDGWLPDVTRSVPFAKAVVGARLLTCCGASPIVAAAMVQRAWFAERCRERVTVPGSPDAFVRDVQRTISRAQPREVPQ